MDVLAKLLLIKAQTTRQRELAVSLLLFSTVTGSLKLLCQILDKTRTVPRVQQKGGLQLAAVLRRT